MSRVVRQDDPKRYGIAEVLALIASAPRPDPYRGRAAVIVVLDGEEIKITNRLRTYLKGTDCAVCGAKGTHFCKTRQSDQPRPHLNLYATNANGHEVLMTSDHIVPRSKGGPSTVENLQPLCATCNRNKADKLPEDKRLMKDKQCQISCGRCCGTCRDLGPDGCRLPRESRPPHCRSFTCEVSDAASSGMIDRDDALVELRVRWGF